MITKDKYGKNIINLRNMRYKLLSHSGVKKHLLRCSYSFFLIFFNNSEIYIKVSFELYIHNKLALLTLLGRLKVKVEFTRAMLKLDVST